MATEYRVTGIYPAIVVNEGEVVSLTAEETVWVHNDGERGAVRQFRDMAPLQAVNSGPWVDPKNAVAYVVEEVKK